MEINDSPTAVFTVVLSFLIPPMQTLICLDSLCQPSHTRQVLDVSFVPSIRLPGVLEGCVFHPLPTAVLS